MISKGILILGALAAAAAGLAFSKKSSATTTPGVTPGEVTPGTTPGTTTTTIPTTSTATTTVPGTTVTTTPGTTTPSSVLPGANLVPPSDVLAAIIAATGTGDPAAMRKVADQLDQKGWKSQAADLRATADLLERAKAQNILTQVQTTTTTPSSNIVDGSNWSQVKSNSSTGYTYLQDPSGTQWPVGPGSIKANSAGGYDYTLSDGRVVRNPPRAPNFYTEGGVQQQAQTTYVLPDIDGTGWLLDLSQSMASGAAILTSPAGAVYQVTAAQISVDTSGNRKVTVPNVGVVKNPTIKAGAVVVPNTEVIVPPVVVPTIPTPVTPIPHGEEDPHAALAGTLVGQLTGKTTANEPHAVILSFQQQENLQKQDGNYGTETAWQLANVYNIVPPNPLHWGTKTGGYNSLVADKKAYAAKLTAKAGTDAARADQWKKAAALALKGM